MKARMIDFGSGLLIVVIQLYAAAHFAEAAVIDARSAAFADVNAAVALAEDGDVVTVPPGTVMWTLH
jgi:hypothetical protein